MGNTLFAIALCIDESYLVPAMATLASVADCLPRSERRDTALRVLTQDLSRSHVSTMEAFAHRLGFTSFDLEWRKPPPGVRIVEGASYITTTTYLRFQLTPRFVDRPYLVYLDADVLVFGDISAPFAGLDGRVGAVRDEFNYTVGECPALPGLVDRWPTLRGRPYFNAGALWLPSHLMPAIRAGVADVMARKRQYIHFNDQDALNLWLLATSLAMPVDERLNRFELDRFLEKGDWVRRVVRRDLRTSDSTLLHFVGPTKPWQRSCPTTEGVRIYGAYLRDATRLLHRLGGRNIGLDRDGDEST
jgi:lipopolysaccharide biosynthesis glycosyltransferase